MTNLKKYKEAFFHIESMRTASAINWSSRFITALCQIGAIRLLTQNIGENGYSAFAIITGLQAWFFLSDFGFGPSMQNRMTRLRLKGLSGDDVFASTVLFLAATGLVLAVLVAGVSWFVGPALLAKIPGISHNDAVFAFGGYGILIVATTLANIMWRAYFSQKCAHVVYSLTALANVLGVCLLAAVPYSSSSHKLTLSLLLFYFPVFAVPGALLLNRMYAIFARRGRLHQILFNLRRNILILWNEARYLFFVTLVGVCVLNIDYIILSQMVKPQQIVSYALINKVFAFAMMLFSTVLMAYWPHSSEAAAKHDIPALRKNIRNCMMTGFVLIGACAVGIAFLRPLMLLILVPGRNVTIPLSLLAVSTAYWFIRIWTDTHNNILQSAGLAKLTRKIVVVQAATNAVFEITGAYYFGAEGLVLGLVFSFIATSAWYIPHQVRYYLMVPKTPRHV